MISTEQETEAPAPSGTALMDEVGDIHPGAVLDRDRFQNPAVLNPLDLLRARKPGEPGPVIHAQDQTIGGIGLQFAADVEFEGQVPIDILSE